MLQWITTISIAIGVLLISACSSSTSSSGSNGNKPAVIEKVVNGTDAEPEVVSAEQHVDSEVPIAPTVSLVDRDLFEHYRYRVRFRFNPEWHILSQMQLDDIRKRELPSDQGGSKKFIESRRKENVLLSLFKYHPGFVAAYSPSLSVMIEDVSDFSVPASADNYLRILLRKLKPKNRTAVFMPIRSEAVNGLDFRVLSFYVGQGDAQIHVEFWAYPLKDGMLVAIAGYATGDQREEIMKQIQTFEVF